MQHCTCWMDFFLLKSVGLAELYSDAEGWFKADFQMEECKLNWLPFSAQEQRQSVLQPLLLPQKTEKEAFAFNGLHPMVQYIKFSKWARNCLTSEQSNTRSKTNQRNWKLNRSDISWHWEDSLSGKPAAHHLLKSSDLSNFMPFHFPSWQQWREIKACNLKESADEESFAYETHFDLLALLLHRLEKKGIPCMNTWD